MKKYTPVLCALAAAVLLFGAWRLSTGSRAITTHASERDGTFQLREVNLKRSMELHEKLQRGDASPEEAAKMVEELRILNEVPRRDPPASPMDH